MNVTKRKIHKSKDEIIRVIKVVYWELNKTQDKQWMTPLTNQVITGTKKLYLQYHKRWCLKK